MELCIIFYPFVATAVTSENSIIDIILQTGNLEIIPFIAVGLMFIFMMFKSGSIARELLG